MKFHRPGAKLSPDRQAALLAHLRSIPDDSVVFPGYLGNKSTATLIKRLRRPRATARRQAARA